METRASVPPGIPSVIIFAALIIIIAGVMVSESIVKPLLMALFISIICAQPILWLQKKKVQKNFAILLVLIGFVFLFVLFGILIGNALSSFSNDAPKYKQILSEMSQSVFQNLKSRGINIGSAMTYDMLEPSRIISITQSLLGQMGSAMGNILTVILLAVFLLLELDGIPVKVMAIFEGSHDSLSYLRVIESNIRQYLWIKTIISLMTGLLIWICLAIIGVDYAIIWALIAFLLNYIPNIGSLIAAIPAILFSYVQLGFKEAIWTTIVFVAVNTVIGNVVEPRVMGKGLGLSTFVVFWSLLFWGFVLGIIGMFLSVPLTMAIKIMLAQKKQTKWIAVLLGTQDEAQIIIDDKLKSKP